MPPPGLRAALAEVGQRLLAVLDPPPELDGVPTGEDDPGRLGRLVDVLDLSDLEAWLLVAAAAADVVPSIRRAVGGAMPIAVALAAAGGDPADPTVRQQAGPDGRLVRQGVLEVDGPSLLGSTARVPERVIAHLLGIDRPDPLVRPALREPLPIPLDPDVAQHLTAALQRTAGIVYLREGTDRTGAATAAGALRAAEVPALVIDLGGVDAQSPSDAGAVVVAAVREATLLGNGLVVGPLDALEDPSACTAACERSVVPVILHGRSGWNPAWSAEPVYEAAAPPLTRDARLGLWRAALGHPEGVDVDEATAGYVLGPAAIARAGEAARLDAAVRGTAVDVAAVHAGARRQDGHELERLAHRVRPQARFDDLVLGAAQATALHRLISRVRHRDLVLGVQGMGGKGSRGRGVAAVFAGHSGTGKTLAAEVVAGELGLDLYTIDLATVIDKYIGETEKNLDRVFHAAAGVNAVLFFDEADALFGKRSAVGDARDRYANVEVAYLLQRIEAFDGISVLATNLVGNMDEAFHRRIDVMISFPDPDAPARRRLWQAHLPPALPVSEDLDLDPVVMLELAGGDIRNAALTAAFEAADRGTPVTTADLVRAAARELVKRNRLVAPSDLGPHAEVYGEVLQDL